MLRRGATLTESSTLGGLGACTCPPPQDLRQVSQKLRVASTRLLFAFTRFPYDSTRPWLCAIRYKPPTRNSPNRTPHTSPDASQEGALAGQERGAVSRACHGSAGTCIEAELTSHARHIASHEPGRPGCEAVRESTFTLYISIVPSIQSHPCRIPLCSCSACSLRSFRIWIATSLPGDMRW
jgi:hypothetical protein